MKNYIEYKRANAETRRPTRKKRKESVINFASSLNRKSNIKYVWYKMKVLKKSFNIRYRLEKVAE